MNAKIIRNATVVVDEKGEPILIMSITPKNPVSKSSVFRWTSSKYASNPRNETETVLAICSKASEVELVEE